MSFWENVSSTVSKFSLFDIKEKQPRPFNEYDQLNKEIKDFNFAPEAEKASLPHQFSKEGLSFSKLEYRLNQLENQLATSRKEP